MARARARARGSSYDAQLSSRKERQSQSKGFKRDDKEREEWPLGISEGVRRKMAVIGRHHAGTEE